MKTLIVGVKLTHTRENVTLMEYHECPMGSKHAIFHKDGVAYKVGRCLARYVPLVCPNTGENLLSPSIPIIS